MNDTSIFVRLGTIAGILIIVLFIISINNDSDDHDAGGLNGTIDISGAFALYPMVVKWGEEFRKLRPNVTINISAGGAGKGISDALGGLVDLGAVSRDVNAEEIAKGAYAIAVTKDAVVPTINAANPNIVEILRRGLSRDTFTRIYIDGTYENWAQAGFAVASPIHPYIRSDASGAGETWAKYLGKKQESLRGTGVFGDPGLLQAVQNDVDGIGFNNIAYVYDAKSRRQITGIAVIPIDIDGSGMIDSTEQFYGTLDELTAAISAGRYPSPPARDLYFVAKGRPEKPEVIEFLRWVLTEGQRYVPENGYIPLSTERLALELKRVGPDAQ